MKFKAKCRACGEEFEETDYRSAWPGTDAHPSGFITDHWWHENGANCGGVADIIEPDDWKPQR